MVGQPDEKPKRKRKQKNDQKPSVQLLVVLLLGIVGLLATVMIFFLQPTSSTITKSVVVQDGTNLLSNSSFEQNPLIDDSVWTVEKRGTDLEVVWTDANSNSGSYALQLSATDSANQGWPGLFTTVQMDSQLDYTFSAQAFSPDGASAWLSIELLDAEGKFLIGYSTGCSEPEAGWHTKTRKLKAEWNQDRQVSAIRLGLQQCMNFSAGQTTTLYFDDVMLVARSPE